jgi:hypothetical protein
MGANESFFPLIWRDIDRAVQPRAWSYALRRRLVAKRAAHGRSRLPRDARHEQWTQSRRLSLVEPQRSRSDKHNLGPFFSWTWSRRVGLGGSWILFMQVCSPRSIAELFWGLFS